MMDLHVLIWILVFVIFLVINIVEQSWTFGTIAGFWLMILGGIIVIDGIQTQTGILSNTSGDITNVEYIYTDIVLPTSTYAIIWGVVFISVALYMIYANLTK